MCSYAVVTEVNVPAGGVDWPARLAPQQATVPSVRIPQVWSHQVSRELKRAAGRRGLVELVAAPAGDRPVDPDSADVAPSGADRAERAVGWRIATGVGAPASNRAVGADRAGVLVPGVDGGVCARLGPPPRAQPPSAGVLTSQRADARRRREEAGSREDSRSLHSPSGSRCCSANSVRPSARRRAVMRTSVPSSSASAPGARTVSGVLVSQRPTSAVAGKKRARGSATFAPVAAWLTMLERELRASVGETLRGDAHLDVDARALRGHHGDAQR